MSKPNLQNIKLTDDQRKLLEYEQLFWLASHDVVWFAEKASDDLKAHVEAHRGWVALVILNDVFGYACADAEQIAPGQAHEIRAFYETFGWDGVIAWVSEKRQCQPLKELQTPKYWKAIAAIKDSQTRKQKPPK